MQFTITTLIHELKKTPELQEMTRCTATICCYRFLLCLCLCAEPSHDVTHSYLCLYPLYFPLLLDPPPHLSSSLVHSVEFTLPLHSSSFTPDIKKMICANFFKLLLNSLGLMSTFFSYRRFQLIPIWHENQLAETWNMHKMGDPSQWTSCPFHCFVFWIDEVTQVKSSLHRRILTQVGNFNSWQTLYPLGCIFESATITP